MNGVWMPMQAEAGSKHMSHIHLMMKRSLVLLIMMVMVPSSILAFSVKRSTGVSIATHARRALLQASTSSNSQQREQKGESQTDK